MSEARGRAVRRIAARVGILLGGGVCVVSLAASPFVVVALKYRPRPSTDVNYHEALSSNVPLPTHPLECFLYRHAERFVVWLTQTTLTALLHRGNTVEAFENYDALRKHIVGPRPHGAALVTVANHSSMADDPLLMSALLPPEVKTNPRLLRWGVCTEDICFGNPLASAFYGLGHALPVTRGGSIYQKGIAALQAQANNGSWVHLFSEGRCWQEGGIPRRDAQGRWCSASGRCGPSWQKVGPLKWGVAKIIANAGPSVPIVVPIYHAGMEELAPQSDENALMSFNPFARSYISGEVGDPVDVAPLLRDYHAKARARAVRRNAIREARVRAAEARVRAEEWRRRGGVYAALAWVSWESISWLWGDSSSWRGEEAAAEDSAIAAAAAAAAAVATVSAASAPASSRTRRSGGSEGGAVGGGDSGSVRPINTVEDASDHTGASARISGLVRRAAEADGGGTAAPLSGSAPPPSPDGGLVSELADALESEFASAASSMRTRSARVCADAEAVLESVLREADALAHEWQDDAKSVKDTASRRLEELRREADELVASAKAEADAAAAALAAEARETLAAVEARVKAVHAAREAVASASAVIRARAAKLVSRMRAVSGGGEDKGDASSQATPPLKAAVGEGSGSSSVVGADAAGASRRTIVQQDDVTFAHVVTPAPVAVSLPAPLPPLTAPSASPAMVIPPAPTPPTSAARSRLLASPPSRFPFSDEPVIEHVPTRILSTGVRVPAYTEAPLRIKPPDYEFLSPAEAEEEEDYRLALYSDISTAVMLALAAVEKRVMEKRRAGGVRDSRVMS